MTIYGDDVFMQVSFLAEFGVLVIHLGHQYDDLYQLYPSHASH